jgi:cell shape-determining protein MreC
MGRACLILLLRIMKIVTKTVLKKDFLIILILLFFGLAIYLIDDFGTFRFLRDGISYVMRPISSMGENLGKNSNKFLKSFFRLGQFTKEYNDMKVLFAEQEIKLASYLELESENEALRKQLGLRNYKDKYVMTSVLSSTDSEHIRIDQGAKSGVKIGDTVSIGNFFVGTVDYVDTNGSLVKLPVSNSSYLQVAILRTKAGEDFGGYIKNKILSKGVLNGTSKGIMVENISVNSSVEDGDIIFINDSKVSDFLVLGYVVGITNNPASTSRTCFVSPIVDYDQLTKVFVNVK